MENIISYGNNTEMTTIIDPSYIIPYILGKQIKLQEYSTKDLHQEIFEMTECIMHLSIQLNNANKKLEEI